ncbi:ubiquitin-protein ligase E3C [Coccinella septempunctata]|uniref:ubiquitin-protein ligase E3C n=1 Tax=Coccinella septempunctata TaxID=41139 RepID=UPI001D07D718|nr:ubiquitin-protein ligase E3C [Coccinella septempunctata]
MAFKFSYIFDGNTKTKPEQNLGGSSKKVSRENLLQKTHEERRKRQEYRLKLENAEILQSHVRSYLVRKTIKQNERTIFDNEQSKLTIQELLSKLLFFYDPDQDNIRMMEMCGLLLNNFNEVSKRVVSDKAFCWLIKRLLVICLKNLKTKELRTALLDFIEKFTRNPELIEFIIMQGYFKFLRLSLDQEPEELLAKILLLIYRPFQYIYVPIELKEKICSNFCDAFLKPILTKNVKWDLIPYLKTKKDFPFDGILKHLNKSCHEGNNSLFYCILSLEPDDFEPTKDSIEVLAKLSKNVHCLKMQAAYVEDSDDEEEMLDSDEHLLLAEFMKIMNQSDKVLKWTSFFDRNNEDLDVLAAFTQLCHNLLLVYKDAVRKYLLLYKLGLNSVFLKRLWTALGNSRNIENDLKGCYLVSWRDCHTRLSVFCDMFTFYTQALTDRENSDTSGTFNKIELYSMCRLLVNVSLDLIDVAFPMCRSSSVAATPEVLHLYNSCLNCVKKLYMLNMRKEFCRTEFWTSKKIYITQDISRKNYLSKTVKPFYGIIADEDEDEHLPPLSTIEQRSLAILQDLPFLINFNTRVLLLRELCRNSLGNEMQRMQMDFAVDNVIVIRRTHLYEDAFEKLSQQNESDLRHKVRIRFINNVGLEEAGIDGGGLFKEFINEVLKTALDPNRGFFIMTAENTFYPNPNIERIIKNFTEHYFFIGRLIGKAIFENILVDLPLAEFFLAKLLVDRAPAHYLQSLDPTLYKNLLFLRDYEGNVTDLGLDFSTVHNDLGETTVIELKPNGRNIPVTDENRLEYIQRFAELKLNTQLKRQCVAFREGLDSVVPLLWLKLFNHKELQVIIGGDNQEIDLIDLRSHTTYGGEYTSDHETIILFWKVVYEFDATQRKQLLKFVTSCSRPPLLGFKELNPPFCIQSSGNDRMPTASTCLNLLKIPVIRDENTLRHKLLEAIEQQAGFELS